MDRGISQVCGLPGRPRSSTVFCACSVMAVTQSAALLVDEVLPHRPMRQWVLSVPHLLRYLFASQPKVMGRVLGIVCRTLATHLVHKAGYKKSQAHTEAVTLIQRFGRSGVPGALNLNPNAARFTST